MGLRELLGRAPAKETKLPTVDKVFFTSIQTGRVLTEQSLAALRDPNGNPIDVYPFDLRGITIEVASFHTINTLAPKDESTIPPLIAEIDFSRKYFWEVLLSEMISTERARLQQPGNSVAYLDHAHNAAAKIIRTRELEKDHRERWLRAALPVHLNVMKGIRTGKVNF